MLTDPLSDLLTRIRNGYMARKLCVDIPLSNLKKEVVTILVREGFVKEWKETGNGVKKQLRVTLRYVGRKQPIVTGLRRVSTPGLRRYVGVENIPKVFGGRGVAILSTSAGVMTGLEAQKAHVGGEVLCEVW